MTRITWGDIGQRFYETGVDRGVLYVGEQPGVPWMGLVSVSENPTGGEAKPYYIDGIKYLNISAAEEFEATIEALQSPPEFASCDGNVAIQNGLIVTAQPRKSFGFSYRTLLGNDVDADDHAYKIHLVYNALAAPASRANNTLSDTVNVSTLSWNITTKPPTITGFKPTAHLVIDSRTTDPVKLATIEDILYGDESESARMPTPDELIAIYNE